MKTQFVLKSSKLSPPFVASTRKADMTKPVKNLIPLMFMAGGASYLGGMYYTTIIWLMVAAAVISWIILGHSYWSVVGDATDRQRRTQRQWWLYAMITTAVVLFFLNLGSEGLSSLGGSILVIMFLAAIALSMFAGGKK